MDRHTPDEKISPTLDMADDAAPPRKRRSRRTPRRILGMWARLGLLALSCAILIGAAVAIVAKVIRPYQQGREMRAQVASLNMQIASKQMENAEYERKLAYLKTPEGVATEARKLGYVRPGEIPVVVTNSSPAGDLSVVGQQAAPPPSTADRARTLFNSILGGR